MKYFPYKILRPLRYGILLMGVFFFCNSSGNAFSDILHSDSIPPRHALVAAQLCQDLAYDAAKSEIELAIASKEESNDVYAWYTRGYIYKEIYKKRDNGNPLSENRELAVESFLQARKLVGESDKSYNGDAALKYLAGTYYNDALLQTIAMNSVDSEIPDALFEQYARISAVLGNEDVNESRKKFLESKAQRYFSLWSADFCNKELWTKSFELYHDVKAMNMDDCSVIYNIAVMYYNLGFTNVDALSKCYGENELSAAAEEALRLFVEAEAVCPQTIEVVNGLLNIYRIRNDKELIEEYERKLVSLKQANAMKK